MPRYLYPACLAIALVLPTYGDDPVFKSDVALSRVDVHVVDRNGRSVTGLQARDFVVRVDGKIVPVRNFASEDMPIDILLLLDVSGSMEPHVERIANAAQEAMNVLAEHDRIAIMVFDTRTRVRLPFTQSHSDINRELNRLVRSEHFNGGTHITHAMLDAAAYVQREARKDARRAIVILTDDETQDAENEVKVEGDLSEANAILSFLQAPYEEPQMTRGPGGRRGGMGGGGWPGGGGGGWPGGGGIGFPGGGGGGIGMPGGRGGTIDPSHTAGTDIIAKDTGGDTIPVDQASALEDTLARLRQRYVLNFYLPEASSSAVRHAVRVDLTSDARLRYEDAEVHSRRVFMSGDNDPAPVVVTRQDRLNPAVDPVSPSKQSDDQPAPKRHHGAVNEESGPTVNTVPTDPQ
jgi:hypothetical protein